MTNSLMSWAKFFIGWPLSFISIAVIIKIIIDKSNEINLSFSSINWVYLSVGVLFLFLYYILRSFLWLEELRERGESITFKENTYRLAFSELKRYVPGNVWSFLSRASMFSEIGVSKKTLAVSLLGDIQLVIIGCGVISLFSIPWLLNSPEELEVKLLAILPTTILAIIIFFAATSLIYRKKYGKEGSFLNNLILPGFKLESKLKLILISIATYFMFGIGNYFIFLSIFNHGFTDFLSLTSFFVLSLLVGYLSFITPMGLGVREGIVTLGLSKITTLTTGGVIAIFGRIVLIISELLFLALIFLWQKTSKK